MTAAEVNGLHGLARKMGHDQLPTNPETGLPEAGILSTLLPVAAGFFLGPAGLGMSTLGAAATVGGVSALASGSLSKGLMAGMGAWGGAGLGGALTAGGVGEMAASEAVKQAGTAAAETAASSAAPAAAQVAPESLLGDAFEQSYMGGNMAGTPGSGMPGAMAAATPPAPVGAPPVQAKPMAPISAATNPQPLTNQFGTVSNAPGNPLQGAPTQRAGFAMGNDHMAVMQDNLSRLSLDPLANDPMKFLKDNAMYGMAAVAPLMAPGEVRPQEDSTPAMIRPYTFNRQRTGAQGTGGRGEPRYFNDSYTAGTPYRADQPRYAEGGAVQGMEFDPATQTYKVQTGAQGAPAIEYGELPRFTYDAATQQYAPLALPEGQQAQTAAYEAQRDEMDRRMNAGAYDGALAGDGGDSGPGAGGDSGPGGFAYGGLTALARGGAPGRHLKGPGDGMSDSIPASIEGVQPAKLAADEFVVPADVVSHLGNGSSDAGAKQLHSMMARVRAQRTGRTKQAPAINARKALPA